MANTRTKIAINGFGRIGRMTLRAILERRDLNLDIVAINDLATPEDLCYLFKFDTVMRAFPGEVTHTDHSIIINGKEYQILAEPDPAKLPWKKYGVDVVIESSGRFTKAEDARKHLTAGAKKVIISAPAKGADATINIGVNDNQYRPDKDHIISNASCTTNCLTPMAKIIHERFGIQKGFMVTVHSYTASQKLVDAPDKKDKRRGRAAAANIVPSSTGAARAIGEVLPELKGKLDGYALRVPTPDSSILDLTVVTEKRISDAKEVNQVFQELSQNSMRGILGYSEEPLVSSDYLGNAHSCTIDAALTQVIDGNILRTVGWYDNEWGFSNRLAELTQMVAQKIPVAA